MRLTGLKFPQDILRAFQEMLREVLIAEKNSDEVLANVGNNSVDQLGEIKNKLNEIVSLFVKNVSLALPTYDKEDEEKVEFIAISFLDEKFIRMDWSLSNEWSEKPLEKDSFGTRNAGTEVFDRIDLLAEDRLIDRYYALLYYLILCCGFAGKYDVEKDKKVLNQYKKSLRAMLEKSFSVSEVASQANFQDAFALSVNLSKSYLPTQRKFNVAAIIFIFLLIVVVQTFWYFKSMTLLDMAEQIIRMGYLF